MNVLVVLGGESAERSVSLESGINVVSALKKAGHNVTEFDPKLDGAISSHLSEIDIVFPILHGKGGEDGSLQKELEELGVLFVGSSSNSSAKCFNKMTTMNQMNDVKFPVTQLVDYESIINSTLRLAPYVLKPVDEGSSIDTFIIHEPKDFDIKQIKDVFERHKNMMIQELIEGIELTASVLIDEALPIIEIVPPTGQEFDFTNKYNGATKEICPPINLSAEAQLRAQEIALNMHIGMGCKSFSRTDFIYTANNELYCLEINTLPGMTAESLLPKAARQRGISIEALVDILVKDANAK